MKLEDVIIFVPEENEFWLADIPQALPKYIRINFRIWKIKMECIFMERRLWEIVRNGTSEINKEGEESLMKKNRVVIDMILAALDKENLLSSHQFLVRAIHNASTANKVWNLINDVYEKNPQEV